VVTRAPVAPQVLGSTPRGSEFLRILTAFVLSVVDDVPVTTRRLWQIADVEKERTRPAWDLNTVRSNDNGPHVLLGFCYWPAHRHAQVYCEFTARDVVTDPYVRAQRPYITSYAWFHLLPKLTFSSTYAHGALFLPRAKKSTHTGKEYTRSN
jgi:hypothetical protein